MIVEIDREEFRVSYERIDDTDFVVLHPGGHAPSGHIICKSETVQSSSFCNQCGQYHSHPKMLEKSRTRLDQIRDAWKAGLAARGIPLNSGTVQPKVQDFWLGDPDDYPDQDH